MEGGSPRSQQPSRSDRREGRASRQAGSPAPPAPGPCRGCRSQTSRTRQGHPQLPASPRVLAAAPPGVRPHLTREGAAEADTGAGVSRGQAGDPTRVVLCLSRVPQLCPSLLGCSFHVVRDAATHDASILSSAGVYRAPAPCQAHRAPVPWGQAAGSERYQGR